VSRFWEELKQRYPNRFEFRHGHGLGVLAIGTVSSPELCTLFASSPAEAEVLREFFHQIGSRFTCEAQLQIARQQLREDSTAAQ
jgi:hypothetical protein